MQHNTTPSDSHTKAAHAHEAAAKIHHSAAESHKKGDHKAGLEHSEKATTATTDAHKVSTGAHADSKAASH
jgi:hypothetical protein